MDERIFPQPAGLLLSRIGLIILFCCMLIAAWFGQIAVSIILGLVMASAGFSKLFSHFALVKVTCRQVLNENRAFPGEKIKLSVELSNRKLLPLPWVQVDIQMPSGFSGDIVSLPENRPGYGYFIRGTALLWYSKITWKTELLCPKRGYFKLGPPRITSGDIFGFYPRTIDENTAEFVIVYPKIYPVEPGKIPLLYPLGDSKAPKRLFDDPTRIMGVRDYNPGDSLRRIHWKATARRQNLQVKVFEPTTTLDVAIFLAVDGYAETGTTDEFEEAISFTASIASQILREGNAAGLFVNTRLADSGESARILPGSSVSQQVKILEALAKTTRITRNPFEHFLQIERKTLKWGTTLIFVFHELPESLSVAIDELKESGYRVHVYQINKTVEPGSRETAPEKILSESGTEILS